MIRVQKWHKPPGLCCRKPAIRAAKSASLAAYATSVLFSLTAAFAQAPTEQMVELSVRVIGAVQKDGKMQPAATAGGFLLDSKHVVTTDACCGKTEDGLEKTALVVQGQNGIVSQPVWSGPGGVVILELKNAAQAAAATLAPLKLTSQGQSVYTVVFPKDAAPTIREGKIQGALKPDGMDVQVYKAAPPPDDMLAGGAMFNACGQVVGINVLAQKGIQFAMAVDALAPGLEKAGVQLPAAGQPCGGAQSDAGKGPPPPQPNPPSKSAPRWRLPQGGEWVGVAIIAAILGLALRPNTRQQVARALTTRRLAVPQAGYAPMPVPVRPLRPVLKGISGQYAGAAVALDNGPSLLGRDQSAANLVFGPESDSVSKRHCVVRWDAARRVFQLEDLGSTNGTYLATGERLPPGQPRELRPGDRFYIGDLRNQFELRMEE